MCVSSVERLYRIDINSMPCAKRWLLDPFRGVPIVAVSKRRSSVFGAGGRTMFQRARNNPFGMPFAMCIMKSAIM